MRLIMPVRSFSFLIPRPPWASLFPYTTLFRSGGRGRAGQDDVDAAAPRARLQLGDQRGAVARPGGSERRGIDHHDARYRSEEHTSELQSHHDLVCRLLLEKKNATVLYFNYKTS